MDKETEIYESAIAILKIAAEVGKKRGHIYVTSDEKKNTYRAIILAFNSKGVVIQRTAVHITEFFPYEVFFNNFTLEL